LYVFALIVLRYWALILFHRWQKWTFAAVLVISDNNLL